MMNEDQIRNLLKELEEKVVRLLPSKGIDYQQTIGMIKVLRTVLKEEE